jgi:hypothetical protein
MSLIGLLVALLVLVVVAYAVRLVLGTLDLPPPVNTIVYLIFALLILVVLLRYLGVWV